MVTNSSFIPSPRPTHCNHPLTSFYDSLYSLQPPPSALPVFVPLSFPSFSSNSVISTNLYHLLLVSAIAVVCRPYRSAGAHTCSVPFPRVYVRRVSPFSTPHSYTFRTCMYTSANSRFCESVTTNRRPVVSLFVLLPLPIYFQPLGCCIVCKTEQLWTDYSVGVIVFHDNIR